MYVYNFIINIVSEILEHGLLLGVEVLLNNNSYLCTMYYSYPVVMLFEEAVMCLNLWLNRGDLGSTAYLVSPSFPKVQFADVITPGSKDEVGYSHVNEDNEERLTDESPWGSMSDKKQNHE